MEMHFSGVNMVIRIAGVDMDALSHVSLKVIRAVR